MLQRGGVVHFEPLRLLTTASGDNNQSNQDALRFWVDVHSRQPAYFSRLRPAALREK
jgi:hypothetical protein